MSAIFDKKTAAGALTVAWSGVNREAPGPPLLLIHGNWSSRTWWEPTLRLLPPRVRATHQQALGSRRALDLALRALSPGVARDDLWRRCIDGGHRQRMTAALRNLDALTAWRPGDTLGQITAPRAVVSGARDLLTGGATARRAAAALKTPLVLLPNVGHCLPLEAPDLCVTELLRLIDGAPA